MSARNLVLVLLLALVARASGAWSVISSEAVSSAADQCWHVRTIVEKTETGDRAQLHLALFDSRKATLRIIDQPSEPRSALAQIMEQHSWLAGVNGGYFDPDYAPIGLLVSDGRVIAPLRKARLLSGILSVVNGRVRLQRVSEFSRKSKITAAVQCGPFLIDRSRAVTGLDDSRPARRTFVAIGMTHQAALGYCSAVSLAQLGQILASPALVRDLKIERALNLDGGSSSAFWFANEGKPFSIPEQKTVRDFVAIVPK